MRTVGSELHQYIVTVYLSLACVKEEFKIIHNRVVHTGRRHCSLFMLSVPSQKAAVIDYGALFQDVFWILMFVR